MADTKLSLYVCIHQRHSNKSLYGSFQKLTCNFTHLSTFASISSSFMQSFSLTDAWFSLLTICPSSFLSLTFAVIQDVDNASLQGQYQSFASLMEQRLAELFVLAGQQGTRFRRATAVGSYTVQVREWHCSPQEEPHLPRTGLDSENNKSRKILTLKCCFILWWRH